MWIAETIDLDNHDSVVKFMKNQSDKIEKLEKENKKLKEENMELKKENKILYKQINYLKRVIYNNEPKIFVQAVFNDLEKIE